MTDFRALYQEYHEACPFEDFGQDTFHGEKAIAAYDDARTALDFGCGNGHAVRAMRAAGHEWFGLEYSQAAFDKYLAEPWFFVGETTQFADRQFDLLYSTEVLEHVPPDNVEEVIADLARITDRYMFLTISLRPSSQNNRFHCTLRPRAWWEERFVAAGFEVDRPVIDCFQPLTLKTTSQILASWAGHGEFNRRFADQPPYELFGEKQFWYFAFRRRGVPARPLPQPTEPWYRRQFFPWLRWLLRLDAPQAA